MIAGAASTCWLRPGCGVAIYGFISRSDGRLTGVPFAIVMIIMAIVARRAVKRGHAMLVVISPFILAAVIALAVWFSSR
jgi:hypothetical protein